jgi:hypothetical protein
MALPQFGSANLVRSGLRPNGPSNTASRHRQSDHCDKAMNSSQVTEVKHPPACKHQASLEGPL